MERKWSWEKVNLIREENCIFSAENARIILFHDGEPLATCPASTSETLARSYLGSNVEKDVDVARTPWCIDPVIERRTEVPWKSPRLEGVPAYLPVEFNQPDTSNYS